MFWSSVLSWIMTIACMSHRAMILGKVTGAQNRWTYTKANIRSSTIIYLVRCTWRRLNNEIAYVNRLPTCTHVDIKLYVRAIFVRCYAIRCVQHYHTFIPNRKLKISRYMYIISLNNIQLPIICSQPCAENTHIHYA